MILSYCYILNTGHVHDSVAKSSSTRERINSWPYSNLQDFANKPFPNHGRMPIDNSVSTRLRAKL